MHECIKLFGIGMNFYGGPGEAAHKIFVKSVGQKTQRCVGDFAKQTANQYYNMMLISHMVQSCFNVSKRLKESFGTDDGTTAVYEQETEDATVNDDEVNIFLSGKHEILITEAVMETMETSLSVEVYWSFDDIMKSCNRKFLLHQDLVRCVHRKIRSLTTVVDKVVGYTKVVMSTSLSIEGTTFYANPCFQGEEWYNFAMVHFEEMGNDGNMVENFYPSWLLGFISINNEWEVVIQCSLKPLCWDDVEKNFIQEIQLGTDFDVWFVNVPINLIVQPLCIIPDRGGQNNKHFVVLPKRNWSRFFGNLIIQSTKLL